MNHTTRVRILFIAPFFALFWGCGQADTTQAENPAEQVTEQTEAQQEKPTTTQAADSAAVNADSPANGGTESTKFSEAGKSNGKGYEEIVPQRSCDRPVVMEFFAYQCPHCYKLEPYAEKWQARYEGNAEFIGIPTHLGHQEFGSALLVHEAAKKLGVLGMATPKLFDRIHQQKKLFGSEQEAIDFLVSAGADAAAAKTALQDQDSIQKGINDNFSLLQDYKVTGVPTVIVNHRYKTDVTMAGGYDEVFHKVDELLKLPSDCAK